jgi:L-arabinose isomerase
LDSIRFRVAVKEWVDKYRLDALTIGCYPHLMGRVCLAASLLADEGIPLGCEGDGYQLALLEGEAVSTTIVFPGNPLRVRFPQPTPALIHWIFAEGIGHHWMAGYGRFGEEIRQWASLCGPALRCSSPERGDHCRGA